LHPTLGDPPKIWVRTGFSPPYDPPTCVQWWGEKMYTVRGVKTLDVQVNDEEAPNADEEVLVGVGFPHITLLPLKCL
jgi:hypothetical protein